MVSDKATHPGDNKNKNSVLWQGSALKSSAEMAMVTLLLWTLSSCGSNTPTDVNRKQIKPTMTPLPPSVQTISSEKWNFRPADLKTPYPLPAREPYTTIYRDPNNAGRWINIAAIISCHTGEFIPESGKEMAAGHLPDIDEQTNYVTRVGKHPNGNLLTQYSIGESINDKTLESREKYINEEMVPWMLGYFTHIMPQVDFEAMYRKLNYSISVAYYAAQFNIAGQGKIYGLLPSPSPMTLEEYSKGIQDGSLRAQLPEIPFKNFGKILKKDNKYTIAINSAKIAANLDTLFPGLDLEQSIKLVIANEYASIFIRMAKESLATSQFDELKMNTLANAGFANACDVEKMRLLYRKDEFDAITEEAMSTALQYLFLADKAGIQPAVAP